MASKTEICNLAIGHLGTGKLIADFTTEQSAEAKACRRFYDITLETILRDTSPPFARKFITLALVEEAPNTEWDFSYRYPNDIIKVRRILSGTRNDSRQSKVSYIEGLDDTGKLIYTDVSDAVIEAVSKCDIPSIYPADFTMGFSFRLAYYIAPLMTGGNAFSGLRKEMLDNYSMHMKMFQQNAYNSEQKDEAPESEFVRGRE